MKRLLAAATLTAGTLTMTIGALAPSGSVSAWGLTAECDKVENPEGLGFYVKVDGQWVLLIEAGGSVAWPEGGSVQGIWWDGTTVDENGRPVAADKGGAYVPKDCNEDTTTTTSEPEDTTTTAATTPPTEPTTPPTEPTTPPTEPTVPTPPTNPTPETPVPVYDCASFGKNYDLAEQWRLYYVSIGRNDLAAGLTNCRPTATTATPTTTKPGLPATGSSPYQAPMLGAGAALAAAGGVALIGTRRRRTS